VSAGDPGSLHGRSPTRSNGKREEAKKCETVACSRLRARRSPAGGASSRFADQKCETRVARKYSHIQLQGGSYGDKTDERAHKLPRYFQRGSFRLTTSDDPPGSRRRRRRERRDARDSYGFNGALFAPRSRHRAGARTRESGNNETKRNETKRNETRRFIFSIFTCATHANDSSDADAGHGCERRRRAGVERVL